MHFEDGSLFLDLEFMMKVVWCLVVVYGAEVCGFSFFVVFFFKFRNISVLLRNIAKSCVFFFCEIG